MICFPLNHFRYRKIYTLPCTYADSHPLPSLPLNSSTGPTFTTSCGSLFQPFATHTADDLLQLAQDSSSYIGDLYEERPDRPDSCTKSPWNRRFFDNRMADALFSSHDGLVNLVFGSNLSLLDCPRVEDNGLHFPRSSSESVPLTNCLPQTQIAKFYLVPLELALIPPQLLSLVARQAETTVALVPLPGVIVC